MGYDFFSFVTCSYLVVDDSVMCLSLLNPLYQKSIPFFFSGLSNSNEQDRSPARVPDF